MSKDSTRHIIQYEDNLRGAYMSGYKISGGQRLSGKIMVQGAKNSALPILAATLLIKEKSIIHNCPDLTDVDAALKILVMLGAICVRDENTVIVDSRDAVNYEISRELMSEMRSSVVFLGAIVSRMGRAVISYPGGCELGPRPIDLHLSALKQLGVEICDENERIICSAPHGIKGANIHLAFPSVGATENIIITSVLSQGTTVIYNAASEPEISDLADFLNAAGAKIKGAGSNTVTIEGVDKLHSVEHKVIPDRIVAATYLAAAAATGGDVLLENNSAVNMQSVLRFFNNIGCTTKVKSNTIYLKGKDVYQGDFNIETGVFPGFPTDAGPIIVPLFCKMNGINTIKETIFKNRFRYISELNKFGADIKLNENIAICDGVKKLKCADSKCTDLRGGAALVLAALIADGESCVEEIFHIERGYVNMAKNLCSIGANIKEF